MKFKNILYVTGTMFMFVSVEFCAGQSTQERKIKVMIWVRLT